MSVCIVAHKPLKKSVGREALETKYIKERTEKYFEKSDFVARFGFVDIFF